MVYYCYRFVYIFIFDSRNGLSIHTETVVGQEWKELLLLMLGAFIGSYGKIIDYWFSDTDKDKMLVQKMDEEDGVSLSKTSSTEE